MKNLMWHERWEPLIQETFLNQRISVENHRGREKHRGDRRQLWLLNVYAADGVPLCEFSHASSSLGDA